MAEPFVPAVGCVRVDIQFNFGGQQCHNIIWCKRETAWTWTQRTELNEAIISWWDSVLKQYMANDMALIQVTSVNQDSQNAEATTTVMAPATAGTVVTNSHPNNVALCATLRTALRGRNYRGRMYFGGIPAGDYYDAARTTATFVAHLISALSALKDMIDALGAVWVVVSRWTNKVRRAQAVATPITAFSVDQYFDSQRRRLGLRGV